jgi:hypothetical protein
MIVSASYRTDVPAFYTPWLLSRLAAGFCRVASPYGGAPYEVSLRPGAVTGFVFWTRNARPLLPHLERIRALAPFILQFTVTGYPRALEPQVIDTAAALAQLGAIARRWGHRAAVWRYDPILVSSITPPDWHERNFAALARTLAESVDEVVVSFAQPYRKTRRNLDAAGRRAGFTWRDPDEAEKRDLLRRLAALAGEHGLRLSLCSQPQLLVPGAGEARCVDGERLAELAGAPLAFREKGNRPGCRCAESRDIGAYDSCAQGCAYCYAVAHPGAARARLKRHNPESERLPE